MSRKIWIIILIGVLIRIVLAFTTFHPDIRAYRLAGGIIASGNVLGFYDYVQTLPQNSEVYKIFATDYFTYPPYIYLLFGLFNFIYVNIFGLTVANKYLIDNARIFGNFDLNLFLFLYKLPYFVFDALAGYFLLKLFNSPKQKFWTLVLWVFNPINLYATYMIGQHDIIPTFFTILSLYFIKKEKLEWAALSLGFGIGFKIYPIFVLVPLVLFGKSWWERIKLLMVAALPYLLIVLPYLPSRGFRSSALLAGQGLKSLYAQIPISAGENILIYPALLIFFYLVFLYFRGGLGNLWERFFIIALLFFVFTHYHPQWFLWLTPFLIIDLVLSGFKHWIAVLTMLFSFIALLLFFDPSLTIGLFSPVWPGLYLDPGILKDLNINADLNGSRSFFQTFFVGAALYFIYLYFPKKRVE